MPTWAWPKRTPRWRQYDEVIDRLPPGPRLPLPVQTALWLTRPAWPASFPARWGDPVTLRLAMGPPAVLTADPALAHRVLTLPVEDATGAEENAVL